MPRGGPQPGSGRPLALTEARHRIICEAVARGDWLVTAARLAGVRTATVRDWLRMAKQPAMRKKWPQLVAFEAAYVKARGQAEHDLCGLVRTGAESDPKCAQWLLERRFGERWAPKNRSAVEVSGPNGGPIATFSLASLSEEELERYSELTRKAATGCAAAAAAGVDSPDD